MSSDVQEQNDVIFKSDAIEQPELPAYIIRVDAFPFSDLSESKLSGIDVVQELQDSLVDALSCFRA